ncbi:MULTISPECIES: hypothetical protein [Asticcacaulis]|jgi:hypothetical protein|uniref:Uncharacterized protein n=1 Tax=Asticcacaulis excentricus TaxID=78587 RepID=A0A3G9G7U4_9CAUL|nr:MULTISPECIES: hypothetical protein [Asticcacaulis]BBF82757.1 hypothetical protein EM6_3398 [Asticcacaulis excentricus]
MTNALHTYRFGPVVKIALLSAALLQIVAGVLLMSQAYLAGGTVLQQFSGVVLGMIPVSIALFLTPVLWRCELRVYEDRLEYQGILLDIAIPRDHIVAAVAPRRGLGMFDVSLELVNAPFRRLHLAIMDRNEERLARWLNNVHA